VFLGLLAALPPLSIDISAPTLALLPQALGTSRITAGLTLSLFMVGFALGQLGGGNLSDDRGRRPVLLAGLTCFMLAGIACTLSWSGVALASARLLQGFGAGSCAVISFAMVQDLFEGDAARAKRSYVTVIFGIVPILAPALGAVLTDSYGWRSVHGILAVLGFALLVVTFAGVAESRPERCASADGVKPRPAARLRDDARFVRIALANALSYGALFAYIAGSPVVIMAQMGLSADIFALVFGCTATALAAGAWTSGRLSRHGLGVSSLLNPGLTFAAAATLILAAFSLSGVKSGAVLVPVLLVVTFTRGIIAPNMQHLAIERQRERAGAASAAVGVSQLLSGAAASAVVAGLLPFLGLSAVALPMAVLASAALAAWYWAGR
jgi:MFS transporter, DHA1 family, multidrug resistance protein